MFSAEWYVFSAGEKILPSCPSACYCSDGILFQVPGQQSDFRPLKGVFSRRTNPGALRTGQGRRGSAFATGPGPFEGKGGQASVLRG